MEEARRIANEEGLDLVEISPNAKPPVVKNIDYWKFKYNQQKKVSENNKKQVVVQLKEIQFRPNIEAHDLETKLKRAQKFLENGDKIKMVMQFRGREMAYREAGLEKFRGIIENVVEIGAVVESEPKMMGNRIIGIIAPIKKPTKKGNMPKKKKPEEKLQNAAQKTEAKAPIDATQKAWIN
jgi:translation initiation factor IF-3